MVNQSLKFLEYFCFTVDYSLHLFKRVWIFWRHHSQELFLACMFQVKCTRMLWKLQGSCISHFCSCNTTITNCFKKLELEAKPDTFKMSLKTLIRGVKQGILYRNYLLIAQHWDVWIKATERIIWMMFNFGNVPASRSKSVFCYYRGDLNKWYR